MSPPPPAALMSRPFGGLGLFLLSAGCCARLGRGAARLHA